jgi:type I restriction enzyme S subunit
MIVPQGWEFKKLGGVAELQRGFDLPSSKRVDGCIPIISSGGLTGFHNEFKAKAPGVVTGRYGSIGSVFYIQEDFWPLNTALWVKDFHSNDPEFIYYMLSSFDFKKFSDKTGVPGVNRNDLHIVKVGVPPVSEQRKIAQILSTWDKSIVTTEKLIAASQQQKKSLMQQLLTGKKRFAGFSEEWKEVKLKQLGEVVSGGTPSTTNSDYWDGDVFWVTPTDITKLKSHYIGSSIRKISKSGLLSCSAKLVPKGSLLVCTRATIGTLAITKTEMCTNQGFKNLVPNKSTDVEFLYYLLAHERHQLISKASGSTFLELSKKDFDNIRLKVPSFKEQQKIAAVLTAADQEIDALQSKLAHFKEEKKALMQQLLTGKRRVVLEAETSL